MGGLVADEVEESRLLMQLEYETLRESIKRFDDQRFKIKGWAITLAGALLAVAVNSEKRLGFVGAGTVLFFAYLDIVYMTIQQYVF